MAAMPGQLELTKLLSQGRALCCAGNKANPPALPNELFSCSFLKPISFNAVYFPNPIVLGTVKTQKHNRSLNPYSQNMSLMHQISLLNQELPPAWKLRAASAFSVAFTEIFFYDAFWCPDQNPVFSLDRSAGFCPLWEMLSPNSFSKHQRGSSGLGITGRTAALFLRLLLRIAA